MGPFFLREILFFNGALGLGLTCLGLGLALCHIEKVINIAFLKLKLKVLKSPNFSQWHWCIFKRILTLEYTVDSIDFEPL